MPIVMAFTSVVVRSSGGLSEMRRANSRDVAEFGGLCGCDRGASPDDLAVE
jgi:hypothetical protein